VLAVAEAVNDSLQVLPGPLGQVGLDAFLKAFREELGASAQIPFFRTVLEVRERESYQSEYSYKGKN